MNYECERCGKKFNRKYNLDVHYKRKIKCDNNKINDINCIVNGKLGINDNTIINANISLQNTSNSLRYTSNGLQNTIIDLRNTKNNKKTYQCSNCLKTFSRNNTLQNHIKNNCKGPDTKKTKCDYCSKTFSKPSNLKTHNKGYCKIQNNMNETNNNNNSVTTDELLEELRTLREEIAKLKSQIESPTTTISVDSHDNNNITINNQTNTQNITNNNQNIILVAFGQEKINEVLTHEEKIKIFERGLNSITVLTEHIHFNEKIPQYNNCYISNRRDNMAIYYDGTKWSLTNTDNIVQTLIDNSKCYLEAEYNESKAKYNNAKTRNDKYKILSDKAINQFNRYLDKKDDEELQKRYDNDTKLLMYNNKDLIMKNKKLMEKNLQLKK